MRETDVLFVPATGKSRAGALKAMGPAGTLLRETHSDGVPGVYLQGLQVFGPGGTLVHESGVSDDVARDVAALASELGLSLIAYSGDDILCADQTAFTDLLPTYHEPACRVIGRWDSVIGDKVLNKFIFMEDPKRIDAIRPKVAERLGGRAALTQAQGNMLEVLPPAASKGDGVKRLLRHLGVAPAEVMAIGDAENVS